MLSSRTARAGIGGLAVLLAATLVPSTGSAVDREQPRLPTQIGYLGAVTSIDPDASAAGLSVLRSGGNAIDAAVATAAALGVTDPFSAGIGGGGFIVTYQANDRKVHTLDGRETAPQAAGRDLFTERGKEIPFDEAVTSGLSVGVPGTPATWREALRAWGSRSLPALLRPAERIARGGFTVDETFRGQIEGNAERFGYFPATRELYLPGGKPPKVGSTFRNPDLADTYHRLGRTNTDALYRGRIGRDMVRTVTDPPVGGQVTANVRPGQMTTKDVAAYRAIHRAPTKTRYQGLDVYGMGAPASGGITVSQALNMLERDNLGKLGRAGYLHRFLEASRYAFADRNRWIGDPAYSDVPQRQLLSQRFADARACLIKPRAARSPVAPGNPRDPKPCASTGKAAPTPYDGRHTTHLTTADRWGNVVAYTLTIEQEGGSGSVVPGRGFLLNNELTDFSFTPVTPGVPDPNLPGPGKRPRSSMAPTIVLEDGRPRLALGSPGGATIITTVLQVLLERFARGRTLPEAIRAPRASQRNETETDVEQTFLDSPAAAKLRARGHRFSDEPDEIGTVTGVERLRDGRWLAAAEPTRRGGGAARVVFPFPLGIP